MKKINNPKKKINLKFAILLLIITTIIASILSVSKFRLTINKNSNTTIAIPILGSQTINLEKQVYPDMTPIEYDLIVENSNLNGKKSEVNLSYTIEVQNMGVIPLKIAIYKSVNNQPTGENLLTDGITTPEKMLIWQSNHKYKLIISWDDTNEDYNSYKYSGETNYLKIDINAVQVD